MLLDYKAYGKDFEVQNEVTVVNHGFGIASAISVGKKKKFNEDCLRLGVINEKEYFLVVTDGHWGKDASTYMIGNIPDELTNAIKLVISDKTFI